ncbi:MAG: PEP-CTERM sorting domain-containing protein [Chthonomonas sp.]|nr:PEP-CTERM sorting domain-containing protein [Chthonomonas sp.]
MNILKRLLLPLLIAAITMGVGWAKVPPNSYLIYTVDTVPDLIAQIKKYPVVSDRFERHFGMTQDEIVDYFKTLRLSKITKAGVYTVYNVPATTGELRSQQHALKAGYRVWVNEDGKPILVHVCGNPMTRGPRVVAAENSLLEGITTANPEDGISNSGSMDVANSGSMDQATLAMITPQEPTLPKEQEVAAVYVPAAGPVAVSHIAPGAIFAPALAILGGILAMPRGGSDNPVVNINGNNGNNGNTDGGGNGDNGGNGGNNAVPEPGTIVVLTLGAGMLAARRKKAS